MKKVIGLSMMTIILLFMSGCQMIDALYYRIVNPDNYNPDAYYGDYPDLCAIAESSLLGYEGDASTQLFILEEDSFGRILFAHTDNYLYDKIIVSIEVSQQSDKEFAYYYDGINYIYHYATNIEAVSNSTKEMVLDNFTQEEISKLKEQNDWDKPLSKSKFFQININDVLHTYNHKGELSRTHRKEIARELGILSEGSTSDLVITDEKGKSLNWLSLYGTTDSDREFLKDRYYMVMLDESNRVIEKTGIEEVKDISNYKEQLKEFKEKNGWCSFPFAETE